MYADAETRQIGIAGQAGRYRPRRGAGAQGIAPPQGCPRALQQEQIEGTLDKVVSTLVVINDSVRNVSAFSKNVGDNVVHMHVAVCDDMYAELNFTM